jgi:hypothetical protein
MNLFKRYISWILLLCITTSHLEGGLFADEEIHGIEELPSFYLEGRKISASQNEPIEQTSIMSLIRERSDYDVENNKSIF